MSDSSSLINEIRNMLLDSAMLDSLQPSELLCAAGYFSITRFEQNEVICNEGDAGTFMCIIHFGAVSVKKTNSTGEALEIAQLRKGRAFGEMAVLDGERRSATCVAISECILLTLAKDSLERMLQESPKSAAKLIRAIAVAMSKRLRMADGQLVEQQL